MTNFNPAPSIANWLIDLFGLTSDVAIGSAVFVGIVAMFAAILVVAGCAVALLEWIRR